LDEDRGDDVEAAAAPVPGEETTCSVRKLTPREAARRRAFVKALTEKSIDSTSSPCSASQTPLRPSPSAMARAVWPGRRSARWLARNAFGAVPKR